MGILYLDKSSKAQNKWENYHEFKKDLERKGFFNKLIKIFDKDEETIFKENNSKIKDLYNGLEHMIKEEKIDPSLYTFGADTIIYKFPESPGMKNPNFEYFLGIDFCIIRDSYEWGVLRKIAQKNKLEIEAWRFHHASLVKKVEELKNPKEILDAVLDFSESHDRLRPCLRDLNFINKLYPEELKRVLTKELTKQS